MKWKHKNHKRKQKENKTMEITRNAKEAQDEKFTWIGANAKNYHRSNDDVSIGVIKNGRDPQGAISFTFRNGCWNNFGKRVEIAIYKNRVMFRTSEKGASLNTRSINNSVNRYMKLKVDESTEALKDFRGDYELKYDAFYELFYVEKENG